MIPAKKKDRSVQLDWLADWFPAWKLVSDEVFSLPLSQAPETLFFDETNVYTTSAISAPKGELVDGPGLFGEKLSWRMAPHNGVIKPFVYQCLRYLR